ncbi:glycosyltransferase family 2 protein [Lyngbya confervoides]|uniref:Glycosyltransferase family 2 protein n=1 Tax=Lyngbya confervoides BDU141951 TaxID=1574623 RepID=A0ABD4T892_9CYAN|nr:glycosyltransferase family A protein [Lyngbya confervoides]MCM1984683.1 glycosyltransferase family 2 protein [Lyngbya confervoides BDU141951]
MATLSPPHSPLVSCIIIFLNEAQFLEAAIESVMEQTYPNWELLLVDDGSTDASPELAQRYAAQYPDQIRYLTHPQRQNLGMSASRNLGIQQARGKYISYLDGDDVWVPHKLADQVGLLEQYPEAALLDCPLLAWHSWTGNPEDQDLLYGAGDSGQHPYGDRLVPPPRLLCLFLEDEQFVPSGGLIRRDVLLEVGGGETDFRDSYEDAVVWVKVCLNWPVYIANQCWYWYRIHPNSCERTAYQRGLAESKRLKYLRWVAQYLRRQAVQEADVWRSLRFALWRARWIWFKAQIKRQLPRTWGGAYSRAAHEDG